MRNVFLYFLLGAGLCSGLSVRAQTIEMRVSVKIIVDPYNGDLPYGISNQVFLTAAECENAWWGSYYRGYRYRITEITNIGGPSNGGLNGPSYWFNRSFRDDPYWTQFQTAAQTDARYRLRSDQINVYVSTGFSAPGNSGGGTPIAPNPLTAAQIFADDGPWWMGHELGHFFGLWHTFGGENTSTCTPGDDALSDTLPDSNCWSNQNQVAIYHFGALYNALSASQKQQVDDVFFNVMSYHDAVNKNTTENRMTELQLDRHTDFANAERHPFVSGYTRFVDTSGPIFGSGTSTSPFRWLAQAVTAAAPGGGDIVLLRPGNYDERFTINKPLTLRATRRGWVTIGRP